MPLVVPGEVSNQSSTFVPLTNTRLGCRDASNVYAPVVERKEATRSEIRHLVSRFFGNSAEELVLNILEDQGVDAEELLRLREMLQRGETK